MKFFGLSSVATAAVGMVSSWGFNIYGSVATNKEAVGATQIANMARNATVPREQIAAAAEQLHDGMYKTSRVLGISSNAIVMALALPSLWESVAHRAAGSLATLEFWIKNWDYALGRALQGGGLALMGVAINKDGKGDPQWATAYATGGTISANLGTLFIYRHQGRTQQKQENQVPLMDRNQQLQGSSEGVSASASDSASATSPSYGYSAPTV